MLARVNKIDIYFESHGFGDPVLLIPGLGSDANTWAPFVSEFSDCYRLVIVENRGSIRSARPPGAYTTTQMAEDAVALLDHLGIQRVHVIGKSMGGMIAQILGASFPERVRSLVLASTLMKHDNSGAKMLERGRAIAEKEGLFATYRQAFQASYSLEYCKANQTRLAEVKELMSRIDEAEALRGYLAQSLACETHDTRQMAGRIKAPSLVIVGNEDTITTPQASRELAAAIPKSELQILPRGGHGIWREFPAEVNEHVRSFLARN